MVIPRFSCEAEEAAWWDAHRPEIEVELRRRGKPKRLLTVPKSKRPKELEDLAQRIAVQINERAERMIPGKRAKSDSETGRIAARVQRRTV
jgi:hypothetical protein